MIRQAASRTLPLALTALLLALPPLHAQTSPDAFVQQEVNQGIAILADKTLGAADRRSQIEKLLTGAFDLRRMALFTLGPAAGEAPPADVEAFVDAYRAFTLTTYEAQLGGYGGQILEAKSARTRGPDDYVVTTFVSDPRDKSSPATEVDFRVLGENGKLAIVDASVEGVWFTVAQREAFDGFLGQNGGSIPKLVDHLKAMAAPAQSATPDANAPPRP